MLYTPNYHLGSVEQNEPLSPLEDSRRFLTIDRQLLGLFQIFGNGVITGWTVVGSSVLSVSVSPGSGNIYYMSAVTTNPRTVANLSPNNVNYIYAKATVTTQYTRDAQFFSDTTLFNSGQQILLAAVTTNASSVVSIDQTVRNNISFIEEIQTLINEHRHLGGPDFPNDPSKIDLSSEVMGQLPGFRIAGLDASIIKTGKISPGRIPLIDHGQLLNSGVLTHPQLDSYVRDLSNNNTQLLGQIGAVNLMQLYLAYKHIWNEVDAFSTNLVVMVPGITPDSQTDFVDTTAVYDRVNHQITGIPALAGTLAQTTYSTIFDFQSAYLTINITPSVVSGIAQFALTRPFSQVVVDSFDNVFSNATVYPDWTLATVSSSDNTTFLSDDSEQVDGIYSAKLTLNQSFRVTVTKSYVGNLQDWTPYNELSIWVQSTSLAHGQIRFQTLQGTSLATATVLDDFLLLDKNITTAGFVQVVRDISSLTRTNIIAIVIYSDTSEGWNISQTSPIQVNIDSITLNNNLYYYSNGAIRFRLSTPQASQWAGISWVGNNNSGTIQARMRTAPNFEVFDQSTAVPFSPFITTSGDDPDVPNNTNAEVEIALTADPTLTSSPVVYSVIVSYLTQNTVTGLNINTAAQFLRATTLSNTAVIPPQNVVINGRIDVTDVVYGTNLNGVQQVAADGTPIVGITGSQLPIAPLQASVGTTTPSLSGVAAVTRLQDRSYLIADTLNDRVMQVSRGGALVQGFATNNVQNITQLYPLTATYNPISYMLYICWSANIDITQIDLTQVTISGAGLSLTLSNSIDTVVASTGANAGPQLTNVLPVLIGALHYNQINNFLTSPTTANPNLYIDIQAAISTSTTTTVTLTNPNYGVLTTLLGLPIFVGNMTYIPNLFRPISLSLTAEDTWLISNAKPLLLNSTGDDPVTGVDPTSVTTTIELDPSSGTIVFSDNSVNCSLITLGAATEVNASYVAVCGITLNTNPPPGTTSSSNTSASLGTGTTIQNNQTTTATSTATVGSTTQTTTSSSMTDFSQLSQYRGIVNIVERSSGRLVYSQYTSDGSYGADVQIDENNNLIVVEKSFTGTGTTIVGSGRVTKLDIAGNVFFQYIVNQLASPNDVRMLSTGDLVISS